MSLPRIVRSSVAARNALRVLGLSASRYCPRLYSNASQRLTTIAPSHTLITRSYTSQASQYKAA
ncbi:hypothetical protein BCR43DRAFT_221316 [Syncephalastrum racemosum]|uniref:Uncharacterized protein n=1 Tax=Syncephalastrum racemosum TaxID=13706 RepID=A0A1X2HJ89_SYNRA|nr:hypothetical protein BCR43DRAFT_221316 [Syncephalastrum racemosum]